MDSCVSDQGTEQRHRSRDSLLRGETFQKESTGNCLSIVAQTALLYTELGFYVIDLGLCVCVCVSPPRSVPR